MRPIFSINMLRQLDEVVAKAAASAEVLHLHRTAERIRAENAGDNIALEDVAAELVRRASMLGVTMELSSDWA